MTIGKADSLAAIRDIVGGMSLTEKDLYNDVIVIKIRDFRTKIDELSLSLSGEEWLVSWLSKEHFKAGVLYAAAKVNRNSPKSAPQSLSAIINRFNAWVRELLVHLDEYEASDRTNLVVKTWVASADAFRADPVNSP
jgi:hypothetical protein